MRTFWYRYNKRREIEEKNRQIAEVKEGTPTTTEKKRREKDGSWLVPWWMMEHRSSTRPFFFPSAFFVVVVRLFSVSLLPVSPRSPSRCQSRANRLKKISLVVVERKEKCENRVGAQWVSLSNIWEWHDFSLRGRDGSSRGSSRSGSCASMYIYLYCSDENQTCFSPAAAAAVSGSGLQLLSSLYSSNKSAVWIDYSFWCQTVDVSHQVFLIF